jgi:DNA polymerase-3 subunit delta'
VSVSTDPWARVVGQEEAVARLRAAVEQPAHAYLFVGPAGSGRRAAARVFAGELFAAGADPDAARRHRDLALAEQHPDLHVVERKGPFIPVGDDRNPEEGSARWIVQRASLSPVDAPRSVWVLLDFHLVHLAAPVLLKTLEEPSPHVTFVVVADEVTPELVTIASRCVRIDFHAVRHADIVAALVAEGADPAAADVAAAGALGSIDRARLLLSDSRFVLRRDAWAGVPDRLDGTGATVSTIAAELAAMLDDAQAPLVERQKAELEELDARAAVLGERGSGRKDLEARHRREIRRLRTDELRYGLTVMAEVYRSRLTSPAAARTAVEAVRIIAEAAESLERNPNESLMLGALLIRLGRAGR